MIALDLSNNVTNATASASEASIPSLLLSFLLTVLVLLFSSYYTAWKSHESNALNGFFKCETFWNYESKIIAGKNEEKEEEAAKLLRHSNYWRWAYNTELFKVRMFLNLIIAVFPAISFILFSILFSNYNPLLRLISNYSYLYALFLYSFSLLGIGCAFWRSGRYSKRGDVSLEDKDKTYWLNSIFKIGVLEPIEEKIETLEKKLEKRGSMKWFKANKNNKYDY